MDNVQNVSANQQLECGRADGNVIAINPVGVANPLADRTRATWTSGDFGRIAATYEASAIDFVARLAPAPRERVLDVACGTGNLALPAARLGADVTGIDIAPNLVAQARAAAEKEQLAARFDVGNCEELPYDDASFDLVMTMFGAMFGARPPRVAAELLRVCRPGGRIAMANWTPDGFVGDMLRIVAAHVPPPAGVPSVLLWGSESVVRERLASAASITCTRRDAVLEMPFGPDAAVDYFLTWYGPMVRACAALDARGQSSLREQLAALWTAHNVAADGGTRVAAQYLDVVATR